MFSKGSSFLFTFVMLDLFSKNGWIFTKFASPSVYWATLLSTETITIKATSRSIISWAVVVESWAWSLDSLFWSCIRNGYGQRKKGDDYGKMTGKFLWGKSICNLSTKLLDVILTISKRWFLIECTLLLSSFF